MSVSMLLVPLAIAVGITVTDTFVDIDHKRQNNELNHGVRTRFNSSELLEKTLSDHGFDTQVFDGGNTIYAGGMCGGLRYKRNSSEDSFRLYFDSSVDLDSLLSDYRMLEEEYDFNVQSFTYDSVMKKLPPDSEIEEEVLEDDSILITITV